MWSSVINYAYNMMATLRETGDHCCNFLSESEENNSSNILPDADSCMYLKCLLHVLGVCCFVHVFQKQHSLPW